MKYYNENNENNENNSSEEQSKIASKYLRLTKLIIKNWKTALLAFLMAGLAIGVATIYAPIFTLLASPAVVGTTIATGFAKLALVFPGYLLNVAVALLGAVTPLAAVVGAETVVDGLRKGISVLSNVVSNLVNWVKGYKAGTGTPGVEGVATNNVTVDVPSVTTSTQKIIASGVANTKTSNNSTPTKQPQELNKSAQKQLFAANDTTPNLNKVSVNKENTAASFGNS